MPDPKSKKAGSPSNFPHDRFFKAVFQRPEYVKALLNHCLPNPLKKQLNLDTLRLSDTNQVNTNLKEAFTDIQLTCNTKKGQPVEIPLILEHKSYQSSYAPYQYMHYQDGIWGSQLRAKNKEPTPIVPIVFYHGKDDWSPKVWPAYLEGWDDAFTPFTPPGGCIFISLSVMTDEEIQRFEYGFMVAALLLMKHRLERDYLLQNLVKIFIFVESDPKENDKDNLIDNLRFALRYLQSLLVVKWEEARSKLRSLNLTFEAMDVLEEVKLEGIEEGAEREKFFATRNMLHKGFDPATINSLLDFPVNFITNVQSQLNKETQIVQMIKKGVMMDDQIAESLHVSSFLVEAVRKDLEKKK